MKPMTVAGPISLLIGSALAIAATGAFAQGTEVAKFHPKKGWTCRDYLALDTVTQTKTVYWESAKGAPRDEDFSAVEDVVPVLNQKCKENLGARVEDKLKAAWRDVKHKVDPHATTKPKSKSS